MRLKTRQIQRSITGSPLDRVLPRKDKGLPSYWAILFLRAVVQHLAGCDSSSPLLLVEKIYGEAAIAFAENRTLGIRNGIVFEAKKPRPTRSRAYASPTSLPRPSPGSLPTRAGSPLAGRDLHPLDNKRNFMKSSHPPIPIDQQRPVALFSLSPEADKRERRARMLTGIMLKLEITSGPSISGGGNSAV